MEMQMWFLLNFYQSILNVSFPTCHWITNFPGQKTQISITFVTLESNFLTCKTFGKSETSGIQSPRYLKDFSNGSRFELTTREGKGALRPLLLPSGWFGDRFTDTAKGASSKMTLNNKLFPRGTREETVALGTSQNDGITSHGTTKEGGWLEEEEEKKKKRKKQKQGNKERERGERGGGKTMGEEAKPPLLQSTATMDSQTDTLCLLFYRPVSFYYRGEIPVQIKASFANFRP